MSKKHPGFKAVQGKIEREGYSKAAAGWHSTDTTLILVNSSCARHRSGRRPLDGSQ
jgi:hypothetical protein